MPIHFRDLKRLSGLKKFLLKTPFSSRFKSSLFVISPIIHHLKKRVKEKIQSWIFPHYGHIKKMNKELLAMNIELEQEGVWLKKSYKYIIDELNLAHEQQMALIPPSAPSVKGLQTACYYKPSMKVGGDYYDFFKFNDHLLGIVIADVSGHGLSAAQVTAMVKMSFYHHFNGEENLEQILTKINTELFNTIKTGHFLTTFLGVLDLKKRKIRYSRAAHPYPFILRRANKTLIELDTKGMMLGKFPQSQFEQKEIDIKSKDRIILYTDGLYEVAYQKKNILGREKLKNFLLNHGHDPLEKFLENVLEDRKKYIENIIHEEYVQEDDIVIVTLEIES